MKVGDLVKLKAPTGPMNSGTAGIIIKLFKKKCWRTQELGPFVDWDLVEPEPHAEIMMNENVFNTPVSELELA